MNLNIIRISTMKNILFADVEAPKRDGNDGWVWFLEWACEPSWEHISRDQPTILVSFGNQTWTCAILVFLYMIYLVFEVGRNQDMNSFRMSWLHGPRLVSIVLVPQQPIAIMKERATTKKLEHSQSDRHNNWHISVANLGHSWRFFFFPYGLIFIATY